MKKSYESPELNIIVFNVKLSDVIMTSGGDIPGGENDLPILPFNPDNDSFH